MSSDARVRLRDHLPEIYRADRVDGVDNRFAQTFLAAFEVLFEELQSKIEGEPGGQGGGIPELFSSEKTPPPQFAPQHGEQEYLSYLASWIGLPLRAEKPPGWNRSFLTSAIERYPQRGTLPGMEGMLRAWLQGEIVETRWEDGSLLPIVLDLTRPEPDSESLFHIRDAGETVRLGINSVLGEGQPFFFIVDLTLCPLESGAENQPAEADTSHESRITHIETLVRTTRQLLDAEKPAHTYYQLRVRAQLTADGRYETWIYNSDFEAAR